MNISGLSYLQFALVDGLAIIYMVVRVHGTKSWQRVSPAAVARQGPSTRGSGVATVLGYFGCLASSILFLVKDGLMARQELDDVETCRAAVYLGQAVEPQDARQLPTIKTGLLLWDLGAALQVLALGCALGLWMSRPLRRLLGPQPLMGAAAGRAALGAGALGAAATVAAHFGAAAAQGDSGRARSVARIVSSALSLAFALALGCVVARVTPIVRRTRQRDPHATAAAVSAVQKLDARTGRPMATVQHLLGMQMVAFMNESAALLACALLLRAVLFLAFDASFLAPASALVSSVAASNACTGLATLAASLAPPLTVQMLLPHRMDVLVTALSAAADMDQPDRAAFIDAQLHRGAATVHMPHLASTLTSRSRTRSRTRSSIAGSKSRSRAATAASLAVEKMGMSTVVHSPATLGGPEKPLPDRHVHADDGAARYLNSIPYIDRDPRESSCFAMGPWAQTPASHPSSMAAAPSAHERDSAVAGAFSPPNRSLRQNTDGSLGPSTANSTGPAALKASMLFSDPGSDFARPAAAASDSGSDTDADSYVPLPSASAAAAAALKPSRSVASSANPSGPSLHAVALVDSSGDHLDSAVLPPLRHVLHEPRPSSFVSEDYQYSPIGTADGSAQGGPLSPNPFEDAVEEVEAPPPPPPRAAEPQAPVYVSGPHSDSSDRDEDDGGTRTPLGPFLIRKGSKASLRRKGTLERRGRRQADAPVDDLGDTVPSPRPSMQLSREAIPQAADPAVVVAAAAAAAAAPSGGRAADKKASVQASRMSAFYGAPAAEAAAAQPDEKKRDSATISTMSWDPKTRASAGAGPPEPVRSNVASAFVALPVPHRLQSHRLSDDSGAAMPSSLFKHRINRADSSSSQASAMADSIMSRNDAFFTPDSSMANMSRPPENGNAVIVAVPLEEEEEDPDAAHDRPSTAPSFGQRRTLAPHECTPHAPADHHDEDEVAAARLRRTQTLRKAVDTDAVALESSMRSSTGADYADTLISALPMPAQQLEDKLPSASTSLLGSRVIL
ncbi:hypothetical protein H4R18_005880 [Coemansia javaensis]|uniref:Uncharacterized protein n=1 Tax=Coemansia javaensis TaxID=2761396 RepID=A0A9W8H1W2_9FUNG|nr:hypothetical protein H4R18_005880 [Coemansia javaensis]